MPAQDVERWALDGFHLNDPDGDWLLTQAQVEPAKKRPVWLDAPDVDGLALLEAPYAENAVFTFRLEMQPQADTDQALAKLALLLDLVQECEHTQGGLDLVNTPAGSTRPVTYHAVLGEIAGLPREMSGQDTGWFQAAPVVTVTLTCKPFGDLPALENVSDAFGNLDGWAQEAGAASVAAGSVSWADPVGVKKLRRADLPYQLGDAQHTIKITTGASVTGLSAGIYLVESADATDRLYVRLSPSQLRVSAIIDGTEVASASTSATIAAATTFWLRARKEGDAVNAELYTVEPLTPTQSPNRTCQLDLTGTPQASFGGGQVGACGIYAENVSDAGFAVKGWSAEPNTYASFDPVKTGTIYGVPGDAPARAALVITDGEGVPHDFVQWGAEQRNFVAGSALYRSTGAAAMPIGRTAQVYATLAEVQQAGEYRVIATLTTNSSSNPRVRLRWRQDDGPLIPNRWAYAAGVDRQVEVDLGTINVSNGGSWSGLVDGAADTTDGTSQLQVTAVTLMPVDVGYGAATATPQTSISTVTSADDFAGATGSLDGRTMQVGGSWATSGTASDFSTAAGAVIFNPSTPGTRYAVAGSTAQTDTLLSAIITCRNTTGEAGLLARYTDANNWLAITLTQNTTNQVMVLVWMKVTGSLTLEGYQFIGSTNASGQGAFVVTAVVDRLGRVKVYVDTSTRDATTIPTLTSPKDTAAVVTSHAALKTGGLLASGKAGLYGKATSGSQSLTLDDFVYGSIDPPRPTMFSGRRLWVTDSDVVRDNADGTRVGRPDAYRGGRLLLPPAGPSGLPTRVAFRFRRDDPAVNAATGFDSAQMQVLYTPRVRAAPR